MTEEDPILAPRKTAALAPDATAKPTRARKPKAMADDAVAMAAAKPVRSRKPKAEIEAATAPAAKPRTRKPAAAEAAPAAAAAPRKARTRKAAPAAQRVLLDLIVKTIDDNKGEDIVAIDLAGKSSIADFMVVASGRSARQVGALSGYVVEAVDKAGLGPCRTEGKRAGDWVLIDAGDVIVHLFRPEVRVFYNLEKMWQADFRGDAAGAGAE